METLSVLAAGMVTGLGFADPPFVLGEQPVLGCAVPLDAPAEGLARLVQLVAPAIRACLEHAGAVDVAEIPLLLGVAEVDQAGRPAAIEERLLRDLQAELGVRF